MAYSGANSFDRDADQEVVFVQSGSYGLMSDVPAENIESVTALQDATASVVTEAVINRTSFDVCHSSVGDSVDCDISTGPVTQETVSLPLPMSSSQLEKQHVIVCKLIHGGSTFLVLNLLLLVR